MEGIDERKPAVGLIAFDAGFQRPVAGAIGFFNLLLSKMKGFEIGAGEQVKSKSDPGIFLDLSIASD